MLTLPESLSLAYSGYSQEAEILPIGSSPPVSQSSPPDVPAQDEVESKEQNEDGNGDLLEVLSVCSIPPRNKFS